MFAKLIDNLAQIDYDKDLNFHRFNEPLADMELLLKRVSQARAKLPKARFTIFSNGDYINRDKLEKLKNAGVNSMLMSYYYGREKSYDKESVILPAIEKMRQKLGLDYKVAEDTAISSFACALIIEIWRSIIACGIQAQVGSQGAGR